jgi:hypothetical protein
MHVDVGHDPVAASAAVSPKARQGGLTDGDYARLQGPGVNVVVVNELQDPLAAAGELDTQQVGAALAVSA